MKELYKPFESWQKPCHVLHSSLVLILSRWALQATGETLLSLFAKKTPRGHINASMDAIVNASFATTRRVY